MSGRSSPPGSGPRTPRPSSASVDGLREEVSTPPGAVLRSGEKQQRPWSAGEGSGGGGGEGRRASHGRASVLRTPTPHRPPFELLTEAFHEKETGSLALLFCRSTCSGPR